MGLLTQLISQHHDTQTRDKANQLDGYKSILNDSRSPEDGGYTNEFKSQILQQMVGMAQGGDGKSSKGGGGGKGKAGEMFGVFQKLLGLHKPHEGSGGLQGGGDPNLQQAAGEDGSGVAGGQSQQPQPQAQVPNPAKNSLGGQVIQQQPQPQQQANPQTLQRIRQIQQQRQQGQAPQGGGQAAPFLTEEQRQARLNELAQADTQRKLGAANAASQQKRDQMGPDAEASEAAIDDLMKKHPNLSRTDAADVLGVKSTPVAHVIGAARYDVVGGKKYKVENMSDGSERRTLDTEKQVSGGGLSGNAKNLLWAKQNENSDDPATRETVTQILRDDQSKRMNSDLQMKLRKSQLDIAMMSHDPASIDAVVKGVQDGITDPNLSNIDRGMKTLVIAKLAKSGFNQAAAIQEFDAVKKAFAAENSQQQLARRQNVNMAKESLPLIKESGEAWASAMKLSGKSPVLNSAELMLAKQGVYGTEAQKAAVVFEGQLSDVVLELSSIYMGSASPTDKAIDQAQKSLSSNWSLPVLNAQLDQIAKNIGRREAAINHVSVFGAGADSSYIPRGTDGQSASTETKTPDAPKVDPPWKIQAKTKPVGFIIDVNGKKFKKIGDDQFQAVGPETGKKK